jgi:hypothetical protein
MKYSIIFLVEEAGDDFSQFFDTICRLFEKQREDFEVLVVANSTEKFVNSELRRPGSRPEKLKIVTFQKKAPQPVCLKVALSECSGTEILTLGSTQELSSDSYEKLVRSMIEGVDLILPSRSPRNGPALNRLHSKMLNQAIRWMLGVDVHDIGCNVKLCRREVLEGLELYGNMFNYLPVFAAQKGFRIREIECKSFEKAGKAKLYGFRQYVNRFSDLATLFFGTHFIRKPLRFFNLAGIGFVTAGVVLLMYIVVERVIFNLPIGARPLLIVGMISLVGGAQLASFGLLGEIISFVHGRSRREYTIEKVI